jgi:quercetin dioxygenase-like cupin family protein
LTRAAKGVGSLYPALAAVAMPRQSQPGETLHNPVTGERAIVLEAPAQNAERRLVVEVLLDPGAAVAGEHLHPAIDESFEVLEGQLGYRLDGVEGTAGAGDRLEIPAGSWHDWWHVGAGETICRVTITPGDRFEQMIRTLWGLAGDGHTNAKGMPGLLQIVAISAEFSNVIVFRRPPRIVQRALFGALAPLARRRGYRGIYPRYAEMRSMGTPQQVRAGNPVAPQFGPGPGPPG